MSSKRLSGDCQSPRNYWSHYLFAEWRSKIPSKPTRCPRDSLPRWEGSSERLYRRTDLLMPRQCFIVRLVKFAPWRIKCYSLWFSWWKSVVRSILYGDVQEKKPKNQSDSLEFPLNATGVIKSLNFLWVKQSIKQIVGWLWRSISQKWVSLMGFSDVRVNKGYGKLVL
jgi:hypothetical protein